MKYTRMACDMTLMRHAALGYTEQLEQAIGLAIGADRNNLMVDVLNGQAHKST